LLDWLVHIKTIQDLQTEAKVIVGVLALTTGVGELITATSWVVRGVAALETTIAASDLILMNTSVRNAVKGCFATPQEGEDFLKSYENITLILNGAAATHGLVRLFRTDIHQFHAKYTARKTTIDASPTVSADAKAALQKLDDAVVAGKVGDVVEGVGSFTLQQIDDYVALATKQGDQTKVMLGKFEPNSSDSYISRAGTDHTYFDMGPSKWAEAEAFVGGSVDEMWRINKKFIDNRRALGNEFYLSHDPLNPNYYKGFYKMEIDYLTKPIGQGGLGGTIVDLGNNLWKVVW
jgi:hypothetical protein